MIYLIYSLEKFLLNREINRIKTENKIDDININYYDLNNDLVENIIDDAQTFSLFDDKKMIVVNNANVFTTKKCNIDQNIDKLEAYLKDYNPSTILVFSISDGKCDSKKKIVKLIKENGKLIELDSKDDIDDIVRNLFDDYKVSNELIKIFIERVGTNLDIINEEINKIKTYKDDDKVITKYDIEDLTCPNIEDNIFLLIDYIVNKKKEEAIVIYHELLKMNEEPIAIIISLANKIRSLYQTKELYRKGYTENDIASILGVKPGYLYYMRGTLSKYNSKELLKLIDKLATMDYSIKKGEMDKELALELFILEN